MVHFPEELREWTLPVASRLDAVHEHVSRLVGSAPRGKVTVLVDDPLNASNGFAIPLLDRPLIYLFPTPPTPGLTIGHHRGWGEILSVHEYAHIAHLTRRSRNPIEHLLWRLSPAELGPVARRSPRWVIEGYATLIEGQLTGSGRPHGAWRAAVLRKWALEGKLPRYGELNSTDGFLAGSMAYLVGSAYLEWLVDRAGRQSLEHLWRRMSARQRRSFPEAFAGVFGGTPDDLYGRFTAELTGKALDVERTLEQQGIIAGHPVQKLEWGTGAPALSPDGSRVAIVLREREEPARLVVWNTSDEPEDERRRRGRERARRLDPEDVASITWRPEAKKPVATLGAIAGRSHEEPRFMPDGQHILVMRSEPTRDGGVRSDLFLWNHETGALRRVTHGAGIRHADPSRDGSFAVGDRCLDGSCDVVRIDLVSGAVHTLAAGSPDTTYYRPRLSPDDRRVAVSIQTGGRWRIALLDAAGGAPTILGSGDPVDRYDAAFLPGGDALVVVSERGGIANLERISLTGDESVPLTRVAGAARSPEPHPRDGSVYFLLLHAEGLDLQRLETTTTAAVPPDLEQRLVPAVPALAASGGASFDTRPVAPSHSYGLGPRGWSVFPLSTSAAEGRRVGLAVVNTDPVGRLTTVVQGALGHSATWRGLSAAAAWRRYAVGLRAELFAAEHRPSRQRGGALAPESLDARYRGGAVFAEGQRRVTLGSYFVRAGVSRGELDGPALASDTRTFALAELGAELLQTPNGWAITQSLALHGSSGRTAGEQWWRAVANASIGVRRRRHGVVLTGAFGQADRGANPYEHFLVGGLAAGLIDRALLSQRIEMPGVPAGYARGPRVAVARATLTGFALEPYYTFVSAGERIEDWRRVIGLEGALSVSGLPFVGLPALHTIGGLSYSLDEPFRHRTRLYAGLVYRP